MMTGSKPQLSSKTIQGLIVIIVGWLLTWFGAVDVSEGDISEWVTQGLDLIGNVLQWAGVAYAWYGRVKAKKTIS